MDILEQINEMWKEDSKIDIKELDHASIHTAQLHQKYLELYVKYKSKLCKFNNDMFALRRDKQRYYRGEMSVNELADRGWTQWLHNKVLKGEMDEVLAADADIAQLKLKQEYYSLVVECVDRIMNSLKGRVWEIKNAVDYMKFKNGV